MTWRSVLALEVVGLEETGTGFRARNLSQKTNVVFGLLRLRTS
jgi:hypothetical protein